MDEFEDMDFGQLMEEVNVQTTMACAIVSALGPKDYQIWYTFNAVCQAIPAILLFAEGEEDDNLTLRAVSFSQAVNRWIADLYSESVLYDVVNLPMEFHSFVRENIGWTFDVQKKAIQLASEDQ